MVTPAPALFTVKAPVPLMTPESVSPARLALLSVSRKPPLAMLPPTVSRLPALVALLVNDCAAPMTRARLALPTVVARAPALSTMPLAPRVSVLLVPVAPVSV